MGIDRNISSSSFNRFPIKLFVRSGDEKSTGLRPQAFRPLLRLYNKHAEQVPNVNPILEVWFLLSNELAKALHSHLVTVHWTV